MARKSLEEYKEELSNIDYEFITILDVVRKDNRTLVKCQCKCGNIFYKKPSALHSLTINCGCMKSFVSSRSLKNTFKNNPDIVKNRAKKCSEWYKNNPDKVKDIVRKHSEWINNNKDKIAEQGRKHSEWFKNNPEYIEELKNKSSQWFKDNPDKVKDRSDKYKQYIAEHPEVIENRSAKYSQWCIENKDKHLESIHNSVSTKTTNRIEQLSLFNESGLSSIHPDDLFQLRQGIINTQNSVRVKCPRCGKYDVHLIRDILNLNKPDIIHPRLCEDCYTNLSTSSYEDELYNYIVSLGYDCQRNVRDIIPPKELDLYIPSKRLAIEFNGSYWHNEFAKDKLYHYNKFKLCKEKDVRLISIFEYDYLNNKDKILNCIKDALYSEKIYARKCSIKELSLEEKRPFINKYHMDGDSNQGNISYGLFYNNELISAISFGKLRGQNKLRNNKDYFELVRFVSKDGVHIIGGLSKLMNRFIKDKHPKYVLCYSDNDYFSGAGYYKYGFILNSDGKNSIDYNWVNSKNESFTRQSCMVHKLLKEHPEYLNIDIKGSKEDYIMHNLGYYKVYRCGNSKWELFID